MACAGPQAAVTCAAAAGAMAAAAGGSIRDVLKAAAFAFIQVKVWTGVGSFLRTNGLATNVLAKGLVHGVVGGALSSAQGGNFLQGFASNAIGAVAGLAANEMVLADGIVTQSEMVMHTAIVAAAGCVSAVISGGKCANGALSAAFANLHNGLFTLVALSAVRCATNNLCRAAVATGAHVAYRYGSRYFSAFARAFSAGARYLGARVAGSIRNVNPTGSGTNCVNCAIATDLTLSGRATSAMPSAAQSISVLEKFYGNTFQTVISRGQIVDILTKAGSGSRGIVYGGRIGRPGHVFNAVNQNGVVRFLDGQTGNAAKWGGQGYRYFQFMRTN